MRRCASSFRMLIVAPAGVTQRYRRVSIRVRREAEFTTQRREVEQRARAASINVGLGAAPFSEHQETKLRVPRADVRTSCVWGVAAHRRIKERTKGGRRTEQTITSPTRISACRSPVPPIDRGRCRLAGIPLEARLPNIVIVVATQENVARPLPGEGTHDVAGVRLWWKRTGVEHWIGVVPSQAVETEGGGTCRRQRRQRTS